MNKNEERYFANVQCHLQKLLYDFNERRGDLMLARRDCTDMTGVIAFFKNIDPEVKSIYTWSKRDMNTSYHRRFDGTWRAQEKNESYDRF